MGKETTLLLRAAMRAGEVNVTTTSLNGKWCAIARARYVLDPLVGHRLLRTKLHDPVQAEL
jgi:hypothetical protein